MKSEKKSKDLNSSVQPNGIVKEELCTDTCKMNENITGEISENDVKSNCNRESIVASTNHQEDTTNKSNKITAIANKNQQSLNPPVKLENNSSFQTDCGGAATSKSADVNTLGKCKRNVIPSSGSETQFMQQQSQVFVFSTMLANKGAEAVLRGQFPSMVAYHCAQPGTKKFLEKHPNKGIKSGQSPAEWLNNFNSSTQKNQQPCNNSTHQNPDLPAVLDSDSPAYWDEQSNTRNGNSDKSVRSAETSVDDTINKVVNSQPSPHPIGDTNCSSPNSLQPSLQGVKVPDENLTPQQLQHREESLAALRKMQILLFPDKKESPENFTETNHEGQSQAFRPVDDVNSPPVSPLDHFTSDVDWDKFPDQIIDQKNKVAADNYPPSSAPSNSRSQGPPPPYNQSARPSSVPVALQNSNPTSPNNPTSTLSLPSPRETSTLNSPADYGRQFHPMTQDSISSGIGRVSDGIENHLNHSNPGTPFSPAGTSSRTQKDSIDFPCSQSPSVDEILCQTLQSVNEEQHLQDHKEANLMPVPSPQQIQYLNTFEGQELTIQKQPNTSIKNGNSSSNNAGSIATSAMRILPESGTSILPENVDRRFADPLPSPRTPRTPSSTQFDGIQTMNVEKVKSEQNSPAPYGQNSTDGNIRHKTIPQSPNPEKVSPSSINQKQNQLITSDSKIPLQSNSQDFLRGRTSTNIMGQPENLPLNPNNVNNCNINPQGINSSGNHFDPITSLAQMSQQLANITPSNSLGSPIIHSGNPPGLQHNMQLIQDMNSPSGGNEFGELGGFGSSVIGGCFPHNYNPVPRPVNLGISSGPPMRYGPMNPGVYHGESRAAVPQRPMMDSHNSMRTNIHVRPGAPNTIQYLPAGKPNPCQGGPRAPPSLDFLPGFTNPPNQRCFANNLGQNLNPGTMHNIPQGVYPGISNRPQRQNGFQTGANYHPNQMRPQMIQNVHVQVPSQIRMQHMVGGGVFTGNRMQNLQLENKPFGSELNMMSEIPHPRMYNAPGINQGNPMAIRPRGPVMNPNMQNVGGSGLKNPPFIGGTGNPTLDPNYAQQYHNFQQQLYATGVRPGAPVQHPNFNNMGTNSPAFLPER